MSRKRKTLNRKEQRILAKLEKSQLKLPFAEEQLVQTAYDQQLCSKLIRHCEEGYGFVEFAAELNISMSTLYSWAKLYPEFSSAMKIAASKLEAFWWKLAEENCKTRFNFNIWKQLMIRILSLPGAETLTSGEISTENNFECGVVILPEIKCGHDYQLIEEIRKSKLNGTDLETATSSNFSA